jgi:hypothetical protein
MAENNGGPHVQVAVFVDRFIRGAQTGSLSLINIVDGATMVGDDPDEMPAFSLEHLTLVIGLWAGQTKGRYSLTLRPEQPSGVQGEPIDLGQLNFPDTGARGVDIIRQMTYEVTEEGTYWFDVLFSPGAGSQDRLLTRIPLTVVYQPQSSR